MRKSGWLGIVGGVVLVVLLGVAGVIAYQALTLKARLADSLGAALGARVEVTSLGLDLWKGELHAAGITLINRRDEAPWDRGEISQAVVHFHLSDLLSPVLPLNVEINSWRVTLHPAFAPASTSGPAVAPPAVGTSQSANDGQRHGIQVTQMSGSQGEVEIDFAPDQHALLHGVSFESSDNGGNVWTSQVQATAISVGSISADASSVELRNEPDKLSFSNLRLLCASGAITGDGDVALTGSHPAEATLKIVDVPVTMLVSVAWQMKLSGLASGTLSYHGDDALGEAQGQLSIAQGKFHVLPFLGKFAAIIGLPDISGMEVDRATTDFDWRNHVLRLANIDVEKADVTRIAGEVDIGADNQVDGRLKMGLPDAVLSKWPQLQAQVFSVPLDGYGWTEVHLTGTPNHLQEDLSPRVLAAGIESGSSLLNQGSQKALDLIKGFLGH